MLRLSVTTVLQSKSRDGNIWFNFETDFPSLDAFYKALAADGLVYGHRVITKDEGGSRVVVDRIPHVLGKNAIGVACPLTMEYREPSK